MELISGDIELQIGKFSKLSDPYYYWVWPTTNNPKNQKLESEFRLETEADGKEPPREEKEP